MDATTSLTELITTLLIKYLDQDFKHLLACDPDINFDRITLKTTSRIATSALRDTVEEAIRQAGCILTLTSPISTNSTDFTGMIHQDGILRGTLVVTIYSRDNDEEVWITSNVD